MATHDYLGPGVLPGSTLYHNVLTHSQRKLPILPVCAGEYYCSDRYRVRRETLDSFLVLFVSEGEIDCNGERAGAGDVLLVDCHEPHEYSSPSSAHTLWLHFDGSAASEIFSEITAQNGARFRAPRGTADRMREIVAALGERRREHLVSGMIYSVLCSFTAPAGGDFGGDERIKRAAEYIEANYGNRVSVADIAARVNVSPGYLSRLFRSAAGCSPYEYLLAVRLERAKEMLSSSDLPVSEVAYRTGFNSETNFISFFKNETSLTPLKFRKLRF